MELEGKILPCEGKGPEIVNILELSPFGADLWKLSKKNLNNLTVSGSWYRLNVLRHVLAILIVRQNWWRIERRLVHCTLQVL